MGKIGGVAARAAVVALGTAIPILAGCGDDLHETREVTSFSEGVSFHITDDSAIPYARIRDALRPNFNLAAKGTDGKATGSVGDGALAKVFNTTGYQEFLTFRALGAAIAANLPTTKFDNQTATKTGNDGVPQVTVNNTTTSQSGAVPTADQLKAQGVDLSKIKIAEPITTSQKDQERPMQGDPVLMYNLAAALVQEVTFLNQALDYLETANSATYDTYIARLRVAVKPLAPNQPYNAYVALGFFCVPIGTGMANHQPWLGDPVKVHPLLVTDDLSTTTASRTAQLITQLSLAISGMIGPVGIGGLFSSNTNKVRSLLGKDIDSTFSISRTGDNTVIARLGAPRQPTAGYGMIDVNQTISVVVQAPKGCTSLNVSAVASLRHATTGQLVADPVQPVFEGQRARLRRYLQSYVSDPRALDSMMAQISDEDLRQLRKTLQPPNEVAFHTMLLAIITRMAVLPAVRLTRPVDAFVRDAGEGYRALWVDLTAKMSHSPYQNVSFTLPDVSAGPSTSMPSPSRASPSRSVPSPAAPPRPPPPEMRR
jgi:hypothetical protein